MINLVAHINRWEHGRGQDPLTRAHEKGSYYFTTGSIPKTVSVLL